MIKIIFSAVVVGVPKRLLKRFERFYRLCANFISNIRGKLFGTPTAVGSGLPM